MALTNSDMKEIEVLIRKEIKIFMDSPTLKQFEDKFMDKIAKEINKVSFDADTKDVANGIIFRIRMYSGRMGDTQISNPEIYSILSIYVDEQELLGT